MDATISSLQFEVGPIRPPSEAYSLLIRVTRNCSWNRCMFCPIYKREKFELRSVEEVKQDILTAKTMVDKIKATAWNIGRGDHISEVAAAIYRQTPEDDFRNVALWLHAGGENAFLQDANTLIMRTPKLVEVIRFLKETLPSITRVTSYSRSKTAAKKSLEELAALKKAGLSRLHIGLESGSDAVLTFMQKGATAAEHISAGKKVVQSGISLSEYVMPGLGGRKWRWKHATETAQVLNDIDPDFIRIRSLTVREGTPLMNEVRNGTFQMPSEDEIVEEIGWLIQELSCHSEIKSDHIMNLLPDIDGRLPEDRERLLGIIKEYLGLPEQKKLNFKLGRRMGYYHNLTDLDDSMRRSHVDSIIERFEDQRPEKMEQVLVQLRTQHI